MPFDTTSSAWNTGIFVECKRYNHSRLVGLDTVNAVLGAARRAHVDHAFLVTTSSFSRDVMALEPDLRDLRVHLRNEQAVRQWLADYRSSHGRLWIAPDLDVF